MDAVHAHVEITWFSFSVKSSLLNLSSLTTDIVILLTVEVMTKAYTLHYLIPISSGHIFLLQDK